MHRPRRPFSLRSLILLSFAATAFLACASADDGDERRERSSALSDEAPGERGLEADLCSGLPVDGCFGNQACATFSIRCERDDGFGTCPFLTQCAPREANNEALPSAPGCSPAVCQAFAASLVTRQRRIDPIHEKACVRSGCNGEACVERGREVVTACVVGPENGCLRDATCELQTSGACGFTLTDEQKACLARPGPPR